MATKTPKPYQKRRSGNWFYKFMIGGVLHGPVCTYTTDKREAERNTAEAFAIASGEAAKVRRAAGTRANQPKDMTLDQLCVSYWTRHVLRKQLSDQRQIGTQLHVLRDTIGSHALVSTIDDDVVERFCVAREAYKSERTGKKLKPHTRNHQLMRLQNILNHARVVEKIATQVIDWKRFRVEKHKLAAKPKRYLTPEETALIFKEIRADYRPIVEFALATGLRRRSLVALTWDRVDEHLGTITLLQKGGREHLIVITPDIAAILDGERPFKKSSTSSVFSFVAEVSMTNNRTGEAYEKGKRYPITYWGLGSYWKGLVGRLDMPHATLHDLRKTFTSDFIMAAGLTHGSAASGHSSEKVTEEHYKTIPSPERVRAAQLAAEARLAKGRFAPRSLADIVPQTVPEAEGR